MVSFPNCKINLGLHVLGKRPDGFHELETLFFPVPLCDGLEIIQSPDATAIAPVFSVSGLELRIPAGDNICLKAYTLVKNDFPELPPIQMHLHKVIPHGAGLGGGSADGAFCLLLLNTKFRLGLTQQQLLDYAALLGSDCPFFIINKPCLGFGRGEVLEPVALDLTPYKVVLVNPGITINTGWAFSQLRPEAHTRTVRQAITQPVIMWKQVLVNDFEPVVFREYPEISSIKDQLYKAGAAYAGMSGTGSTVYGIFPKDAVPQLCFPAHYFINQFAC